MQRRQAQRTLVAVAIAGAAHALLLLLFPAAPRLSVPSSHTTVSTFHLVWSPPSTSATSVLRASLPAVPGAVRNARAMDRVTATAPYTVTVLDAVSDAVSDTDADSDTVSDTATVSDTHTVSDTVSASDVLTATPNPSLSAAAAARAVVFSEVAPPASSGLARGRSPRSEHDVEAGLATSLGRDAATKTHVTPPRALQLVPRPDGSFHYDGLGFDAEILRDGRVVFRDRDLASVDEVRVGPVTITPEGGVEVRPADSPVALAPRPNEAGPETATVFDQAPSGSNPLEILQFGARISTRFDLDGALHGAHGSDPHQAERARFLQETEALRERLEEEARRRRP